MKWLKSTWFLAFAGLILSLLTTAVTVLMNQKFIIAQSEVKEEEGDEGNRFWTFRTQEIDQLVLSLKEENERAKERLQNIALMEARIKAEQEELNKIKQQIEKYRQEISNLVHEVDANEQKNLKNLASMYSTLTPEAAVSIFEEMDEPLVANILAKMNPDVVGPIFQVFGNKGKKSPEAAQRAARISEILRFSQSKPKE